MNSSPLASSPLAHQSAYPFKGDEVDDAIKKYSGESASNTYLLVPILLLFLLLIIAVLRSPSLISSDGIGSAIIVMTPLVLATYSLMVLAMAGRGTVDLSVGPLMGFINVTLVVLHGAEVLSSPVLFFLFALAIGIAYQLLMGLIIVYVRVQPIIVALSGYLALSGINLVILPRPGGIAPEWMSTWGLGTSILSPILVILLLSTAAWLIFTRTAFYGHLRLMGSDERAAYTSGVRITMVRLGAHCIAGIFSALAALTYTALIGSGDPTQGTTYTLISITALVLGGTSLVGGRGGVIGSLFGAVNLFLIGYVLATFNFGAVQGFATDLAYGVILVLSLLLTIAIPWIQKHIHHISTSLIFIILSMLFVGVILHAKYDYSKPVIAETNIDVQEKVDQASSEAHALLSDTHAVTKTTIKPLTSTYSNSFIFEHWQENTHNNDTALPKLITLSILVGISILMVIRALVLQAQQRKWLPRMIIILVILLTLSAYLAVIYFDGTKLKWVNKHALVENPWIKRYS